MPNEFVARNGLISQNNVIVSGSVNISGSSGTLLTSNTDTLEITGSLLVTGSATFTGSVRFSSGLTGSLSGTASYANNADALDGLDSSVFTLTSSFQNYTSSVNTTTSSLNASVASLNSYTSSNSANVTTLFAASASLNASVASLNSYTSSLNARTSSFATTGSNTFNGNQTITGSLNVSSNITTPGTLTAQTLVVQTITSSVDFVTGSTRFGTLTSNTHQFTGSVSASGSLNINSGVLSVGGANIGIGTTTPGEKLEVIGNIYINSENAGLIVDGQGEKRIGFMKYSGREAGIWRTGSAQDFEIGRITSGSLTSPSAYAVDLYLDGNGNVGIGTTSPTADLHVYENSDVWHTRIGGASGELRIGGQNGSGAVIQAYTPGGTVRDLYIQRDGGSVGIGTTSPGARLDVSGNGLFSGTVTATDGLRSNRTQDALSGLFLRSTIDGSTITNNGIILGKAASANNAVSIVYTHSSDGSTSNRLGLGFWSADNLLNLVATGNVGIGTTSPGARLDVVGTGRFSSSLTMLSGTLQVSGSSSSKLNIESNYSGGNVGLALFNTSGTEVIWLNAANGSINGTGPAYFGGNVGIGTSTPSTKLDVAGSLTVGTGVSGANTDIKIVNATNAKIHYVFSDQSTGELGIESGTSAGIKFNTNTSNTRMVILSGGSVGIGTTSPPSKFTVSNAGAEGIELKPADSAGVSRILFFNRSDSTRDDAQYDALTHQFQINTGIEAMRITSGGLVGIGVTNPSYVLHVKAPLGGASTGLRLESSGGTSNFDLLSSEGDGNAYVYLRSNYNMIFGTNNTERMRITSGGNVGIGTTTINNRLEVDGNINVQSTQFFRYNGDTGLIGSGTSITGGAATQLGIRAANDILFATNGATERMRITSGGVVLIGSTSNASGSPTFYIQNKAGLVANIAGWNFSSTTTAENGNNNILSSGAYYNGSAVIATQTTATMYQQYNGEHLFYTNAGLTAGNSYSGTERMRITSNGNVGIGTTSPLAKLDVNGASFLNNIFVETRNAAATSNDYPRIFTSDGNAGGIRPAEFGHIFIQSRSTAPRSIGFVTGTTPTERMTVAGDGAVGIGNNQPTSYGSGYANFWVGSSSNIGYLSVSNGSVNLELNADGNGVVRTRSNHPLILGTNETERMRITSGGNVGIGTTSPSMELHVADVGAVISGGNAISTSTMKGIRLENTNNSTESIGLWFNTGGNHWSGISGQRTTDISSWSTDLRFYTHETNTVDLTTARERMRISSEGNIGIGSTSPISRLSISQDTDALGGGISINSSTLYVNKTAIHINSFGTGTGAGITFENKSVNTAWIGHRGSSSTDIHFEQENGDFVFSSGTYTQVVNHTTSAIMTIKKGGSVGIGTTSPGDKLHVSATYDANIRLTDTGVTNADWVLLPSTGNSTAIFRLYNRATATVNMTWTPDGNVGINTTSPSYKLDVNGTARFGAVIVGSLGTGTVYSNGGTLTNTNPSDRNLKENISPITYGLNEVLQLDPVTFNWKDGININKQFGFIAQDVQEVMPDAVVEGEYLGLEKDAIYTALINAIKELKAEIDELKNNK